MYCRSIATLNLAGNTFTPDKVGEYVICFTSNPCIKYVDLYQSEIKLIQRCLSCTTRRIQMPKINSGHGLPQLLTWAFLSVCIFTSPWQRFCGNVRISKSNFACVTFVCLVSTCRYRATNFGKDNIDGRDVLLDTFNNGDIESSDSQFGVWDFSSTNTNVQPSNIGVTFAPKSPQQTSKAVLQSRTSLKVRMNTCLWIAWAKSTHTPKLVKIGRLGLSLFM